MSQVRAESLPSRSTMMERNQCPISGSHRTTSVWPDQRDAAAIAGPMWEQARLEAIRRRHAPALDACSAR